MFFIVWNICICIVYLWFASEKYFDLTWTIPPKPLDALISKLQRIFLMAPSLEYLYCVFSATTDLDYSNFDLVSFAVRSSKYFSGTCLLVFKNQSINQQNWKNHSTPNIHCIIHVLISHCHVTSDEISEGTKKIEVCRLYITLGHIV